MAEPETEEQAQPGKPVESMAIVVRNPDGSTRVAKRGSDGKFVRTRKMPSSLDYTRRARKLLDRPIEERTRKEIVTVYDEMVNHMIDIARGKVEGDPKDKAAAVMAFKELTLRVFGKPSTSEEDREAATQGAGIRVVVIPSPELMVKDIIEEKPREQLKPSFIDAEVVSTNSKE
jgi:hypothetical protein